jgi:hypothetical protein
MIPPLFLDVEPHHKVWHLLLNSLRRCDYWTGHRYVRCPRLKGEHFFLAASQLA